MNHRLIRLAMLTATTTLASACSMMPSMPGAMAAPAMTQDGVLVGANSMTLYTFDRDAAGSGKSACNGPCAANWPPLTAKSDDKAGGDWTVVTRDDGSRQWAFKGKPVHFWAKDQKPGDRTGDGFNSVWHLIKP